MTKLKQLEANLSAAIANLTATQERCTSLIDEARAARAEVRKRDAVIAALTEKLAREPR